MKVGDMIKIKEGNELWLGSFEHPSIVGHYFMVDEVEPDGILIHVTDKYHRIFELHLVNQLIEVAE
jgi:hypothetical protein